MPRVLIVEDDPMARQLLEICIEQCHRYELIPSVESAAFTELCCRMNSADLILMDVCTALNANGIEAAERIKQSFPNVKVIIITGMPDCSFIDQARKAGVDSFWYKSAPVDGLLAIMDRTMEGERVYPDSTPILPLGNITSDKLTDRELEVLRLVVEGETDAVIAEKLHISLRTVKTHIQSMRNKTGFRNRTELAVQVRGCGLVINSKSRE